MPEITIYITNKNYGKYLNKSINSALKQNFQNFEIIIIDDGSTDNSKKIIEKFRKKKNIRIFYRKSKGLLNNINFAIRASRANFILRLDADDYLDSNALTVLHKKISENKEIAMVYPDYYEVDINGKFLNLNRNISLDKQSKLKDIPAHGACSLIRKTFLEEVGYYDVKVDRQDGFDIWFKFINNYKIKNVNIPLFYYRQHKNNLTTNQRKLLKIRSKLAQKFVRDRNLIKKNQKIPIIIPVRGKQFDISCMSLEKLKKKQLLFYSIDQALKCNFNKKVIVTTSDKKIIKLIRKKYSSKVFIYKRDKKMSFENTDMKNSVLKSVSKFYKKSPQLIVILAFQNPLRESFYIEKAVNTLALNSTKVLFSVNRDNTGNYFFYGRKGLRPLRSDSELKLEREAMYVQKGGISVFDFKEYKENKKISKQYIGHIIVDERSSFEINSLSDISVCEKIFK